MKNKDKNNHVVYEHYTIDTNELFYVGEGRPDRPFQTWNRNRYWHFKVAKHGGDFSVKIVSHGLTKMQSEELESSLIVAYRLSGEKLVNFCDGPMLKNHWLTNAPKESHPMYGKKFPNGKASKRMKAWNREHSGPKSPVWGMKRPDLVARNKKTWLFNYRKSPVRCVELNKKFSSIREAKEYLKKPGINIHRALNNGSKAGGYHWERVI